MIFTTQMLRSVPECWRAGFSIFAVSLGLLSIHLAGSPASAQTADSTAAQAQAAAALAAVNSTDVGHQQQQRARSQQAPVILLSGGGDANGEHLLPIDIFSADSSIAGDDKPNADLASGMPPATVSGAVGVIECCPNSKLSSAVPSDSLASPLDSPDMAGVFDSNVSGSSNSSTTMPLAAPSLDVAELSVPGLHIAPMPNR